jgi:hypothetical protein
MTYATMSNNHLIATRDALDELLEITPGVGEPGYDEQSTLDIVAQQLAVAAELAHRKTQAWKFVGMSDGLACYETIV